MRFSRSLCAAGLAALGAAAFAAFFGFGLADLPGADLRGAAFLAVDGFGAGFLVAFLTGFLAAFRGLSPAIGANLAWAAYRPKCG